MHNDSKSLRELKLQGLSPELAASRYKLTDLTLSANKTSATRHRGAVFRVEKG